MTGKHFLNSNRRLFMARSATVLGAMVVPGISGAALAYAVTPLSERVSVINGVGGNVLVFQADDGLILVDSGAMNATGSLQEVVNSYGDGVRVKTLFNSHWHQDQVGGNAYFAGEGANIIAHEKTRLHLATDYYLFEEDRYQPAMPAAAHPRNTFYTQGEMKEADEEIAYGYLELAHTDGDIYVHFGNANIIAAGDVISPGIDPDFDWFSGGWIGGRVDALNLLLDISDTDTQFVPSYGSASVSRAYVESERDLMQFLYETLVDQIRMGFDAQDSLASGVMDKLPRRFDDPYRFLYDAHKGLWAHHNKLEPNIV